MTSDAALTLFASNPAFLLIAGAFLVPLFGGLAQRIYRVALPVAALAMIATATHGGVGMVPFLGLELTPIRIDALASVFATAFAIMLVIGAIYAWHLEDRPQHTAAFVYGGSALGVVFAGDLITLYVFWELMALSSVWLIWFRRTPESWRAGWRYILVHAAGGLVLLVGILLHHKATGSIAFDALDPGSPGFHLILIGFMINAAVPPLHAWLTDAYPEATVTGAIFLSALTTKTAVYTLIRGFPGTELLVWFGAVMAIYGVVYAVLANDIRRLLAYHIVSQVGYMVAAVGMGTAMALNGAASHAFTHIIYKGLLFMGAGAVIHMTGRSKLTELGGLYRWMPATFFLYMVGAFSISAFPLFSGFVSKTMVVEAAALDGRAVIWLMLSFASAGTFLHTGLKLPYFTFLGQDSGLTPREAPRNMLIAMGLAALLCVYIGIRPDHLYALMPTPVDYHAYTLGHVLWELQLLLFTGVGFFVLLKHVGGEAKISLDTDFLYRRLLPAAIAGFVRLAGPVDRAVRAAGLAAFAFVLHGVQRVSGYDSPLSRTALMSRMVGWVVALLAIYLAVSFAFGPSLDFRSL